MPAIPVEFVGGGDARLEAERVRAALGGVRASVTELNTASVAGAREAAAAEKSRQAALEGTAVTERAAAAAALKTTAARERETAAMAGATKAHGGFGKMLQWGTGLLIGGYGLKFAIDSTVGAYNELQVAIDRSTPVFGKNAKAIQEWGGTTAHSIGLAKAEAITFADNIGRMLRAVGEAPDKITPLSEELVTLAQKAAILKNLDSAQAVRIFQMALAGRALALKQLGIVIDKTEVSQRAADLGLIKATDISKGHTVQLTVQQKAAATLSLILEKGKGINQEWANSQDSMRVKSARFHAAVQNLKEEIGAALAPTVEHFLSVSEKWLSKSENQKKITDAVRSSVRVLVGVLDRAVAVIKALWGPTDRIANAMGGWKRVIEGIIGLKLALWMAGAEGGIAALIFGRGGKGGGLLGATTAARGLRGQLLLLTKLGIAGITIPIVLDVITKIAHGASAGDTLKDAGLYPFVPAGYIWDATIGRWRSGNKTMTPAQAKAQFIKEYLANNPGATRADAEREWKRRTGIDQPGSNVNAGGKAGSLRGAGGAGPIFHAPRPGQTIGKETQTGGEGHDPTESFLGGTPAGGTEHDWIASAGTTVLAPEAGVCYAHGGHDPSTGIHPHNVFGWSLIFQGDSGTTYAGTHLAKVYPGRKQDGDPIGVIGGYKGWKSHLHWETKGGGTTKGTPVFGPSGGSTGGGGTGGGPGAPEPSPWAKFGKRAEAGVEGLGKSVGDAIKRAARAIQQQSTKAAAQIVGALTALARAAAKAADKAERDLAQVSSGSIYDSGTTTIGGKVVKVKVRRDVDLKDWMRVRDEIARAILEVQKERARSVRLLKRAKRNKSMTAEDRAKTIKGIRSQIAAFDTRIIQLGIDYADAVAAIEDILDSANEAAEGKAKPGESVPKLTFNEKTGEILLDGKPISPADAAAVVKQDEAPAPDVTTTGGDPGSDDSGAGAGDAGAGVDPNSDAGKWLAGMSGKSDADRAAAGLPPERGGQATSGLSGSSGGGDTTTDDQKKDDPNQKSDNDLAQWLRDKHGKWWNMRTVGWRQLDEQLKTRAFLEKKFPDIQFGDAWVQAMMSVQGLGPKYGWAKIPARYRGRSIYDLAATDDILYATWGQVWRDLPGNRGRPPVPPEYLARGGIAGMLLGGIAEGGGRTLTPPFGMHRDGPWRYSVYGSDNATAPMQRDISGWLSRFTGRGLSRAAANNIGGWWATNFGDIRLGLAGGWMVPGIDRGIDTVPAMLRPGEMVLNGMQQARLGSLLGVSSQRALAGRLGVPMAGGGIATMPPGYDRGLGTSTAGRGGGTTVVMVVQPHFHGAVLDAPQAMDQFARSMKPYLNSLHARIVTPAGKP